LKGPLSCEGGLRLIPNGIAASAAKYGLVIEPLLSLSIGLCARIFVRIHRCGAWTVPPPAKHGEITDNFSLAQAPVAAPKCEHCGFKTHLGGPMWAGSLHNPYFIQKILAMLPAIDKETYRTIDRVEGMLKTALEEDIDLVSSSKETTPNGGSQQLSEIIPRANTGCGIIIRSSLASVLSLKSSIPRQCLFDLFRDNLCRLGYRSTRSQKTQIQSVKMLLGMSYGKSCGSGQKSPIKEGALSAGSAGATIMRKSRDALQDDSGMSMLKREVGEALESGQDLRDLKTKIEAALYRSCCTIPTSELNPSNADGSSNDNTDHKEADETAIVFDKALAIQQ
jgi:tRNA (guanine26-N2/guanine27-N2)-dimethyltransferase